MLIAPGVVLIRAKPARIVGPPYNPARPLPSYAFALSGEFPRPIYWDVTLADGNVWRYWYGDSAFAPSSALYVAALQRPFVSDVGGLNGGELFNGNVRWRCSGKMML